MWGPWQKNDHELNDPRMNNSDVQRYYIELLPCVAGLLWCIFFLHLDFRANISFLSFVNCAFIHGIIIFYIPEMYLMHWTWCLGTLRYEVCNYLFVLWTKIDNAFYIFPERLPRTSWCQMTDRLTGHYKVLQWSKVKLFGLQIGRYTQHASIKV